VDTSIATTRGYRWNQANKQEITPRHGQPIRLDIIIYAAKPQTMMYVWADRA